VKLVIGFAIALLSPVWAFADGDATALACALGTARRRGGGPRSVRS